MLYSEFPPAIFLLQRYADLETIVALLKNNVTVTFMDVASTLCKIYKITMTT